MKFTNLLLKKKTSYSLGRDAEYVAISFLKKNKWQILEHNYKTKIGEIDIIAKKDDVVVAFEVKYRKDKEILPYVISRKQQGRIGNALLCFIQSNPKIVEVQYRFDVLLVDLENKIDHIENAWYFED